MMWAASLRLFHRFGKRVAIYCGGAQTGLDRVKSCLDSEDDFVKMLGGGKGLIYYHPGGNWGTMYRTVQEMRFKVWKMAKKNNIKFISGPQTLHYTEGSEYIAIDDASVRGLLSLPLTLIIQQTLS